MVDTPFTQKLRPGGLLRCCTQSLAEYAEEPQYNEKEGLTLACKWCKGGGMIFRDGAWEWNRPAE